MKTWRVAVIAIAAALAFPGRGADSPVNPCRYLTTTHVGFNVYSTHFYADTRVTCFDEYTNEYQGRFAARAWVEDETDGTVAGESKCEEWCYMVKWVGAVGGVSIQGHCYRSEVEAYSTFYRQGAGSGQQCTPREEDLPPLPDDPPPRDDDPVEYIPLEQGLGDPLVFDLNGDGIHTTSLQWPVSFDMLGDGIPETMAWTHPVTEEGFLWIDLFANNVVDDGRELLGTGTVLPSGQRARDGFEALAVYDDPEHGGNHDGVIDREDGIWSRLRLWVDRNHDGRSSAHEVRPIHENGIVSIRLADSRAGAPVRDVSGNLHVLRTTYSARQGNTLTWREVHNLMFAVFE